MMTVITETTVKPGQEAAWEAVYRDRFEDARQQPGWVAMQLLTPADGSNKRIVVGTWNRREDWERWHQSDTFMKTREKLNELSEQQGDEQWYSVAAGPVVEQ